MNVTISGASGLIGRRLAKQLETAGHAVSALSRSGGRYRWDPMREEPPAAALETADAVVHLAGEPVAQRWTAAAKRKIRDSRVTGTRHLVQALSTLSRRPGVLVCASAIGIYGSRGDETLTESSQPGSGFLPEVCVEWEQQAELAEALGIRVVRVRIGIVLAAEGGALAKMLPPFKMFVGGRIGSGRQWMSWIHIEDLARLLAHCLTAPVSGPVNGTAPQPVTNAEFTRSLARVLRRPALLPVPAFALKAIFGEMAEILLASQRVLPKAAEASGFRFEHPELGGALRSVLVK